MNELSNGNESALNPCAYHVIRYIPNLIRETGDKIEGSAKKGRVLTFKIRKK